MLQQHQPNAILVVGEAPAIGPFFCARLTLVGFEVRRSHSADAALLAMGFAQPLRALVTCVSMPGSLNGLSLATIGRRQCPNTKIILVVRNPMPHMARLADAVFSDDVPSEHIVSTLSLVC